MSNRILIGIVALASAIAIIGFLPYVYQSYADWRPIDWVAAVLATALFLAAAPSYALWLRSQKDAPLPRYRRPPL